MNDPHIKRFMRAAIQRLHAGGVLLESGLFIDSMYLAGYGVECSLKAMLLAQMPMDERADFIREHLRGQWAHSFDALAGQLRLNGVVIDKSARVALRRADVWTVELRYETRRGSYLDSSDLLDACQTIVRWVEGRL